MILFSHDDEHNPRTLRNALTLIIRASDHEDAEVQQQLEIRPMRG